MFDTEKGQGRRLKTDKAQDPRESGKFGAWDSTERSLPVNLWVQDKSGL